MKVLFRARGSVQGVGFRAFARRHALSLGIAGWVRNEADGSVAGQASGEPSALAAFQGILRAGPPWGLVESLDWEPLNEGESLPTSFEIRS
ncbi:MAG: acylphosphatase [Acidobacteriota bacterium]|nr:acylphosphatase [Acidobacteriota bacterium]